MCSKVVRWYSPILSPIERPNKIRSRFTADFERLLQINMIGQSNLGRNRRVKKESG